MLGPILSLVKKADLTLVLSHLQQLFLIIKLFTLNISYFKKGFDDYFSLLFIFKHISFENLLFCLIYLVYKDAREIILLFNILNTLQKRISLTLS